MPPRKSKRRKRTARKRPPRRWFRRLLLAVVLLGLPLLGGWLYLLDREIQQQFEGKRWAVPARVFARPLELFPGLVLDADHLEQELRELRYRRVNGSPAPGSYARAGQRIALATRGFTFSDGAQPPQTVVVEFAGGRVGALADATGQPVPLLRLEPVEIGGIYPAHNEDRVLIRLDQVPPLLIDTLLSVEDRTFWRHRGVDPLAIARALWANLRGGRVTQGGSTLTQQLVKNFFLTPERSLWRKLNEAAMALMLERRYGKREILEAYLNEVFLGQQGNRAIHGFGRASLHYFGEPVERLDLSRAALLVGMLKGATYYDPRRHPERARERRDRILTLLEQRGVVSATAASAARGAALGVQAGGRTSTNRFPAFLDLVRRQLRRDYRDEDLRSEGLRIFTTLDPRVQREVEAVLARRVGVIERSRGLPAGQLQAATVVTSREGGEVMALAGGRSGGYTGFNRALDALRPIGSLVKPAVYLAALERGYTLLSTLDDSPLSVSLDDGTTWSPANYDRAFHGPVPLIESLANSYNVATARLGMDLGLARSVDMLRRLGLRRPIKPYPSLLLGAVELSPIEVAQLYQTIAGNGFYTPLRAIREVVTPDGGQLQRYPLTVEQRVDPRAVLLLTRAMQEVARTGTARSLPPAIARLGIAGKTGTTNDLRDSWFAGFTGSHLAVVWLGRDGNEATGLTGASGALQVWGEMMAGIGAQPLVSAVPEGVEMVWVEIRPPRLSGRGCKGAVQLPFVAGSQPAARGPCAGAGVRGGGSSLVDWLKGLLN